MTRPRRSARSRRPRRVGRTTLHRYFAERSDLLSALAVHVLEQVAAATERAAPEHGPAPEALGRICREYFELGDVLTVLFNEPIGADAAAERGVGARPAADRADRPRAGRGQHRRARSRRPGCSTMLWALLYSAWSLMREQSMPRHEALDQCLRSLHKAVAAP